MQQYVSIALVMNLFLFFFASSTSMLVIVYFRAAATALKYTISIHKKTKTMPRNVRSHRTCVNHRSICSEIGLSYVKGVLVTRYHLLPMFLLTPCGLSISKSLHGSGCVLEQQQERYRGASVQRSFLDFSFYIYHIQMMLFIWGCDSSLSCSNEDQLGVQLSRTGYPGNGMPNSVLGVVGRAPWEKEKRMKWKSIICLT